MKIKPIWLPGHERSAGSRRTRGAADVAEYHDRRRKERAAARALEGSLISLAALVGSDVKDPDGHITGQLRDVVVRWTRGASHPAVTAFVVRIGRTDVRVAAHWMQTTPPASVSLRSTKAYAKTAHRQAAEVALAHDVLDRQVIDARGVQLVRPADVYLTVLDGTLVLAGIEVGVGALLRRLGPTRLRRRVRPQRVIDWASLRAFSPARDDGVTTRGRRAGLAGVAGTRLELGVSAGHVREDRPLDVQAALQSSQVHKGQGSA